MFHNLIILFSVLFSLSCNVKNGDKSKAEKGLYGAENVKDYKVTCYVNCSDSSCVGVYEGPEFIGIIDTAHRLSNLVSNKVGLKLKDLYKKKRYSRVDFNKIEVTTEGMGDDVIGVKYSVKIPFVQVSKPCDATTSFDHSGGWNHTPDLEKRKTDLLNPEKGIVLCNRLEISPLIKTKENLQEYWIQWRNTSFQSSCNCE